jgi:hypothetical protein
MHKLDYSALRARKVAAADYVYAREAPTALGYRFYDPLVGSFSSRSLQGYFDALQDRLSSGDIITQRDVAFFLSGPMNQRSLPDNSNSGARRHGFDLLASPKSNSENMA